MKLLLLKKCVAHARAIFTNTHIQLQAVISCLSDDKTHEAIAKIEEGQLVQALEYFNLPDSMWPTGLYVRHTHRKACDKLANQLMITIKANLMYLRSNLSRKG